MSRRRGSSARPPTAPATRGRDGSCRSPLGPIRSWTRSCQSGQESISLTAARLQSLTRKSSAPSAARCGRSRVSWARRHEALTRERSLRRVLIGSRLALMRDGTRLRFRLIARHMPEPRPEIGGRGNDGERAGHPDEDVTDRLEPEPKPKLRQDEPGEHDLRERVGLADRGADALTAAATASRTAPPRRR